MTGSVLSEDHKYFKQLDGLRFLAVGAVMFGHWMDLPIFKTLNLVLGSVGVNLFFVLSGFLITRILIKSKLEDEQNNIPHWRSIKQFYVRRTLRIFPIYYLLVFVTYALDFKLARETFWWLISYTTNIYWCTGGSLGAFGHLWSLAVEEQFYLFFPFFILFIPKRYILKSLYFLVVFSLFVRLTAYILHPSGVETYALMLSCLDSFGIGGLLAFWFIFDQKRLSGILNKKWIFYLSFLLFLICCLQIYLYPLGNVFIALFYRFSFSICCFWVIGIASLKGFKGLVQVFLENKIIIYLGKISYGLYLYHHFMPYLSSFILKQLHVSMPFPRIHVYEYAVFYFLLTLMLSMISWHIVEKPFNSLKKYFEYK